MKDLISPAIHGASGSYIAVILGLLNTSGIFNAFLFGVAGALGGVLVEFVKKRILKWRDSKK